MESAVDRQAFCLLAAFALGAGIGLLYDCIRPLRRMSGRFCAAALDTVFAVSAGTAAFTFSMGALNGRLGLWELSMMLAGFLTYMYTVSDRVFALLTRLLGTVQRAAAAAEKILKKTAKLAIILFQKVRKCFIIKT